jgi:hypothetical protein
MGRRFCRNNKKSALRDERYGGHVYRYYVHDFNFAALFSYKMATISFNTHCASIYFMIKVPFVFSTAE